VRLLLGAHVSIAGGIPKALLRGMDLGCSTIQIFTKNASQWKSRDLPRSEIKEFKENRIRSGIDPIAGHDSYLINLANPTKKLWKRSVEALLIEIDRCEALGLSCLVVHPGAHLGSGENEGLRRIAESINLIVEKTRGYQCQILLETTGGQGTQLGYRFEHIKAIIDEMADCDRIGVCFDTCHVFVGGYDLRTLGSCRKTFDTFDRIIGLNRLRLFHLNDSLRELGSRVDRHQHIGEGYIGQKAFTYIITHPRFKKIPKVIETPKKRNGADTWDRINLDRLRALALRER
jgi:deoxyribonuclease-4